MSALLHDDILWDSGTCFAGTLVVVPKAYVSVNPSSMYQNSLQVWTLWAVFRTQWHSGRNGMMA